ncbi:MAG TPA: transaldolase [Bdellovibrionota bacterium]|nr:transaldolase [Bdellovibrionota bacterium]
MTTARKFQGKIKVFLDGAIKEEMLEMSKLPVVKGFTTNPSLMRKAGVTDYKAYCLEMLKHLPNHPISFEVFSDDMAGMEAQAQVIKTWGKNVYVKIPVINSKGESMVPLIKKLSHAGVQLNVTAIFDVEQTAAVCEALTGGAPSIVSVFAGRLADTGLDPIPVMKKAAELCRKAGPQVELLWASTREAYNVVEAEDCGCQIITAPKAVIEKVTGFEKKTPQEMSRETVMTFKKDSEASGFAL